MLKLQISLMMVRLLVFIILQLSIQIIKYQLETFGFIYDGLFTYRQFYTALGTNIVIVDQLVILDAALG